MEQQLNAFNFVCCKINQCSILTIRGIDEREKKRAQTKQQALVFTANAKIPLEWNSNTNVRRNSQFDIFIGLFCLID